MPNHPYRIGIVAARFNEMITTPLHEGAEKQLIKLGIDKENIATYWVPGAVEIPLIAQAIARKKAYDAIITLAAVIRGETGHYDFVCKQVSDGCQQVALAHGIPVIFGVLTTENIEQAKERIGGSHGHIGESSAVAALDMITTLKAIDEETNRPGFACKF